MKYYSQYKQDKFLNEVIFGNKINGFFIDIGAHDGVTINNTYFFEEYKYWKGICVEPNPNVYNKLVANRKARTLNVCIGDENKTVKFTQISGYSEMLSGMTDKYDERHRQRINELLMQKGDQKIEIEVDMIKLDSIESLKNQEIDFISIDTEGNEFDIVKSLNFKLLKVKALVVENNYKEEKIKNYLAFLGYKLVWKLGTDEVFVHENELSLLVKLRLFKWRLNSVCNRILLKLGLK
jgi:FkbM family methyltransferase